MKHIPDGTSKTYMVGEKWMWFEDYYTGLDSGDNEPGFAGNNIDTIRLTSRQYPLASDTTRLDPSRDYFKFGSAHPGGFLMSYCDSSVHFVSFDLDADIHAIRGNRHDGLPDVE